MKLTQKIYVGFIISGLLAIAIAMISYLTIGYVSEKFRDLVDYSTQAEEGIKLINMVSELQHQSLIYTHNGHKSAAEKVYQLEQSLHQHLDDMQLDDNKIKQHLYQYMVAFKQLDEQRQLQYALINDNIRTSASNTEKLFKSYISTIANNYDHALQLKDREILNTLLLVEKNAMRYFDTLNPTNVVEVKKSLKQISSYLQENKTMDTSAMSQAYVSEMIAGVLEYEKNFLEAVQRTRAYLFLVNVVMSAEAYEVVYQAKLMSQELEYKKVITELSLFEMLNTVNKVVLLTIIVSAFLAILLPLKIGRSITLPIVRLSSAFNELSKGALKTKIPTYTVDDEMGELTYAAEVLKEKNRQTEQLFEESKNLSRELDDKKKKLERSNDELEQFVFTVSHDLKSPLVSSMGFIGIIRSLAAKGKTKEAISKLSKVVKANERMGQLIDDLLELSRVNRIHLDKKNIDLNELLATFKNMHRGELEKNGIAMQIKPGLPMIFANESRILQLFENLFSNSVKYASNQKDPIMEIGTRESEHSNLIYFRDNGPGVPKEYHEKIFKLFHRLDNEKEGTGIGLTIAAKVMKFHNGKIWIDSEEGKGAKFWLEFDKDFNRGVDRVL